jgi:hypothetical protein
LKVSDVITRQQRYLKDSNLNDNIVAWCDEAQREIASECRWPWLRKTTSLNWSVTNKYAELPDDLMSVEYITNTDNDVTELLPDQQPQENLVYQTGIRWHEGEMAGSDTAGYKRTLRLTPDPSGDTSLSLHYYKVPTLLTTSTQYIQLPNGAETTFNEIVDLKRLQYEDEDLGAQDRLERRIAKLMTRMRMTFHTATASFEAKAQGPFSTGKTWY